MFNWQIHRRLRRLFRAGRSRSDDRALRARLGRILSLVSAVVLVSGLCLIAGTPRAEPVEPPTEAQQRTSDDIRSQMLALLGPPPRFETLDPHSVALGHKLFYDPILSGNRNISCATCHHPRFGTGDGVSLSLGEGGSGLGPERHITADNTPEQRIPRNAPALFNLGATEFTRLFHDGRLERLPDGQTRTPLGGDMVDGFASVLAAQTMFPVLSGDEMAGHYSENDLSQAVRLGLLSSPGGAWDRIAQRVRAVPQYQEAFHRLLGPETDWGFVEIANAIADFMQAEWRADASPFDLAMRSGTALPAPAARGLDLFYGRAGCSACHSGWFQTDHAYHAIAMPQLGPGKAARFEDHTRDDGRLRVTGEAQDAYRFRTPSLRNVALTAPYGHSGAYATLDGVIRHHLDPVAALASYDRSQVILPDLPGSKDWAVMDDPAAVAQMLAARDIESRSLTEREISDLIAFLHALTDEGWKTKGLGIPETVPSGLAVDR